MGLNREKTMNKPKISVLIPAYNHEKYIKDCIASVLNQTFGDFELLITDDCSSDKTVQIIQSFSDERITGIFFDKNQGTVRCLNHLLSIAKGEYIAVLGSDDVWELNKLEKQLEILESDNNLAACFSWATIIDQDFRVVDNEQVFPIHIFNIENFDRPQLLREFYISGNHFCHSSVLIRKDIHDKIGEYNPAYRQLHDFDLWVRLLLEHEVTVIKEPLVKYRCIQNSGNLSEASVENDLRMYNEAENIISFLFEHINSKDFLNAFSKDFVGCNVSTKAQINCEKFLMLKERKLWIANNTSLAMDFLFRQLDEEMLSCLEHDYGISLKQLYDYTAMFRSTYNAEMYPQLLEENARVKEESIRIREEHEIIRREIEKIIEDRERIKGDNDRVKEENERVREDNERIRNENESLKIERDEIFNSTSWRITKPIRKIMTILRRVKGD